MNPRLYILMRTDLGSLNPGKAMAQAAHAANQFVHTVTTGDREFFGFDEWRSATPEGFGTTIVLAVPNEDKLDRIVDNAIEKNYAAGVVLDPTYPLQDGQVTHLVPVKTCGYLFQPEDPLYWELYPLPLHP